MTLDDDVRLKLEAELRKSGKSLQELVNETLRIGQLSHQAARQLKPFKVRARNLGLKPSYSFDKPWELIEKIEESEYR